MTETMLRLPSFIRLERNKEVCIALPFFDCMDRKSTVHF